MASLATLQSQLASVQAAIAKAERAQSVSTDGVSVSRANLDTLYRRQDALEARIARKEGGGGSRYARTRVTGTGGL